MNVRKPLLSTSALKHRGVTIIFDHDYDRIIFRNEKVTLVSHDCHSYLHITLANGIPTRKAMVMAGRLWEMTWTRKSAAAMFIRTVAESKTQPCITFVETRSGLVISFMCARKGGYEDLTKEILRHFEAYGFLNPVITQCDKEISIVDVCRKVARERNARTVLRFAPKTSPQSNGFVEAVHGHIQGLARCFQTQVETNTGIQLSSISPAIPFAIRHAGFVVKIHSATRRQNPIPIFARNSICITFVHVW